jgi:lysosomal Pro-X carboxypeptidase
MFLFFIVLAAWMRLKYPHIAIGALASSAPILQFDDIVPADTFYNIVSNDFKVSIENLIQKKKQSRYKLLPKSD